MSAKHYSTMELIEQFASVIEETDAEPAQDTQTTKQPTKPEDEFLPHGGDCWGW